MSVIANPFPTAGQTRQSVKPPGMLQAAGRWTHLNPTAAVGIMVALTLVLLSVFAPLLAPYPPNHQDLALGLTTPTLAHGFGTDALGRDLFSRVLWAGRTSLTVTAIVLVLGLTLGVLVGVCAGYFGGWVDEAAMRVTDLFLSLPTLILALALVGVLGPGMAGLIIALTVSWWPAYARLVRSQILAVKNKEFVFAAEAIGGQTFHIMRRHLFPEMIGPISVQLSLDVGHVILTIAALGFLGVGIQPPTPEWGTMLVDARPFMQTAPFLVLVPGLAILVTVFGFNSLGEGLEHWLNPWK